ncbi:helix-turn-helix domain-containing protein [Amycolatopsis tucumanensis]|uniref:helix-turn-helix domain-containing protein n=1 Tax=Amycolatopsis tucumanensis TaxID=401106 RepID=UPI003D738E01
MRRSPAPSAPRDTFWRCGYAGTSIQDLTDATGVGTQSLYGAFSSKRERPRTRAHGTASRQPPPSTRAAAWSCHRRVA